MSLSFELGKRIVAMQYEDLPAEALRWAKIAFVDTLGCAFAGAEENQAARFRRQHEGRRLMRHAEFIDALHAHRARQIIDVDSELL